MTAWTSDDRCVRSAYGRTAAWFRGTQVRCAQAAPSSTNHSSLAFDGTETPLKKAADSASA